MTDKTSPFIGLLPTVPSNGELQGFGMRTIEAVVLVLVSAAVAAWLRLPALSDLWTTPYGNMLLRKLFFVVVVLFFGLYHWRRVVTVEWTEDTRARFRRSAIVELFAGAVVVAFTALLISTALPT